MILVVAFLAVAVLIISKSGAVIGDALGNHLIDSLMQHRQFFSAQSIRHPGRHNPGQSQALVRINITQTGNHRLVQDKSFDGLAAFVGQRL